MFAFPPSQVDCPFNMSLGSGDPPQGTITAQASTTATADSGTAFSPEVPIDFSHPTQQWDIAGCVQFAVSATTQGGAGGWQPQLTGLPQQEAICDSRTLTYTGQLTPAVPVAQDACNGAVTVSPQCQYLPA